MDWRRYLLWLRWRCGIHTRKERMHAARIEGRAVARALRAIDRMKRGDTK